MPPIPKTRPRFPTFLRHWRLHRNLTQEVAADRLRMDRSTLSKIERGKVPYDQALLEAASEAYRCDPADLLMRDPKSPIWTLLDTVQKLPPEQQKHVAGMIKGYVESLAGEAA